MKIAYYIHGNGRPILITPVAWGLPGGFLLDLMSGLETFGQLITFDPPGTGSSSEARSIMHLGMDGVTSALHAVLIHLELSSICLLGHSNGGQCALKYAVKHEGNLSAFILISTSGRGHMRPGEVTWSEPLRKAWRQAATAPTRRNFARVVRRIIDEFDGRSRIEMESRLSGRINPERLQVTAGELRRFDLLQQAKSIRVPTLLVTGEDDRIVPLHLVEELGRSISHSTVRILAKTGHFPFYSRPREFARMIGTFLRRHCEGSSSV
jgi:pimeloyl-ACP methyl ester carboxylesterase